MACSTAQTQMLGIELRKLLSAVIVACFPIVAIADDLTLYRTSLHGPERLRVFALTRMFDQRASEPGVRMALRRNLAQQGHYYSGNGQRVLSQDVWLFPVLGYDGNINGGALNNRFRFGGLVFDADPSILAKSGLMVGGGIGTQTRVALASGTFLDLLGTAEVARSPRHRINRSQAEISACLRDNLVGWTFVDICSIFEETEREMGRSTRWATRAALSSLHQVGLSYHEARVELEIADYGPVAQNAVTFGLRSVFDGFLPFASISLAEQVPDEMAFRSRITAGLQVPYDWRLLSIFAWAQFADGGRFLGVPREDRTSGLSVSGDISRHVSFSVTYTDNNSSSAFFDYEQIELKLNFKGYSW